MTSKEIGLERLKKLSRDEIEAAIAGLTHFVMARLRVGSPLDRTRTGAHCEGNLGVEPVQYYVSEAVSKLFDPNGWEWKFERFTLEEQLIRIAHSLMSKKVSEYLKQSDHRAMFDSRELSDVPGALDVLVEDTSDLEELSAELHKFVMAQCAEEFNLEYYATCFFARMDKDSIAKDMGLPKPSIELLHKKLIRKALKFKSAAINNY